MIENLGVGANCYQKAVLRTAPTDIFSKGDLLVNGILGLTGEAGECSDCGKKHLFQGHEVDRE